MAVEDPHQDPELPQDARLGSLDERIERMRQEEARRTQRPIADSSYRLGQVVLGHLIGAPAGGFLMGLGLDSLFGTKPTLMVLFLLVGFGVGIRNVIRISKAPPECGPGAGK